MEEWLADRELQALRQNIAEGLEYMADVYHEVEHAFNGTDEELHCALDEDYAAAFANR